MPEINSPWQLRSRLGRVLAIAALCVIQGRLRAEEAPLVTFRSAPGRLEISVGDEPFATFSYEDDVISRPYFSSVCAPGGVQVTRNHPPIEGRDSPDHATMHPGIWMSFGDINGVDFWRLAAPVQLERFVEAPQGGTEKGSFTARFNYIDPQHADEVICREDFHWEIHPIAEGRLIVWDSVFSSDKEFAFGDQEEMGLGFRTATAIRAERESEIGLAPGNGEIVNSRGEKNEKQIWGKTAQWCDYSGEIGGERAGIAVFCHPGNFRPSWLHARDYGMLAVNAFGRAAFGKGFASRVVVKPGEQLRLRYGMLVHAGEIDRPVPFDDVYAKYLELQPQD